jgi:hypothetical protein
MQICLVLTVVLIHSLSLNKYVLNGYVLLPLPSYVLGMKFHSGHVLSVLPQTQRPTGVLSEVREFGSSPAKCCCVRTQTLNNLSIFQEELEVCVLWEIP